MKAMETFAEAVKPHQVSSALLQNFSGHVVVVLQTRISQAHEAGPYTASTDPTGVAAQCNFPASYYDLICQDGFYWQGCYDSNPCAASEPGEQ